MRMDETVLSLLSRGEASIVLKKDGDIVFSQFGRGIGPALTLFDEHPALLRGAEVYDTIVGKAAASLFLLGGAAFVWGQTMSRSAEALLTRYGVPCACQTLTDEIINRQGTGLCPFEQAVLPFRTPEECLPVIRATLRTLKSSQK